MNERQRSIYAFLKKRMVLTFPEIQAQFGISSMTAHRDINLLVQNELAEKYHGGVRLPTSEVSARHLDDCVYCQKPVSPRTAFVIHLADQRQVHACCPHCGLLHLANLVEIRSAMGVDFLYGQWVNAKDAVYLAGSAINICCSPSVLCLDRAEDAVRLQAGFGGQILAFPQAVEFIRRAMQMDIRTAQRVISRP